MIYRLLFKDDNYNLILLRKLMLLGAIILDILSITLILGAILGVDYHWIDWFELGIFLAISFLLRLISVHLIFSFQYELRDKKLIVKKIKTLGVKLLLNCPIEDIESIVIFNSNANFGKLINVTSKKSEVKRYVLKVKDKNYLIRLDNFMYAKLIEGMKNDLL